MHIHLSVLYIFIQRGMALAGPLDLGSPQTCVTDATACFTGGTMAAWLWVQDPTASYELITTVSNTIATLRLGFRIIP